MHGGHIGKPQCTSICRGQASINSAWGVVPRNTLSASRGLILEVALVKLTMFLAV